MWGNGSVPRCPWYLLLCSTDGPVCSYMWCPLVVEARMPSCSVKSLCDTLDCSPLHSSVRGIFPDKNTGVHCQFPLQGNFPTQGSSLHLLHHLHCRQSRYCWAIREAFGGGYLHLKSTLNEDEIVPNFISQNESTKAGLSKLSCPLIKQA